MSDIATTLSASHLAKEGGEAEVVDWLWWGRDEADKEHVSFGRWQKHPCQHRYKLAAIQPTEHDHPQHSPALAKGGDAVREALDLLNPEHKSGPPQPLMHPNAEWCETYQRWFGRALRHTMKTQHVALSTPTEGPASQTEGMGGDALREALDRVDLSEIDALFQRIPSGPYQADARGEGWEVRQIDTDPTNKHHWPFRLCNSIQGQKAACDDAIFPFIAAILNVWPTLLAALTPPETAEAVPDDLTAAYMAGVERGREEAARLREDLEREIKASVSISETLIETRRLYRVEKLRADDAVKALEEARAATASDPAPATDDRERLVEALRRLANAEALAGVRGLVAGWNGEDLSEGPFERHPKTLGATLPKTNCGAVYELDEALTAARAALATESGHG